jgi:hypothetical protein
VPGAFGYVLQNGEAHATLLSRTNVRDYLSGYP